MNIGNLFVRLGVVGGDKAKKQIDTTSSGMVGLSKKSLTAIAALAGVSYGFKTLYDRSLRLGTGLTKFSNYTGMSSQELQRWQYIAKQSGVSAEEMTSSISGLQDAIGKMHIEGEIPKFLQMIGRYVEIDNTKLEDTYYLLSKLQEFSRLDLSPRDTAIANQLLGEFISPEVIGMLRSTRLTPDMVPQSALLSDGEAKRLQEVQAAGARVQQQLEVAMAKLVNQVGPDLIKNFERLIPEIIKLTKTVSDALNNIMKFFADPKGQVEQLGEGLTDKWFWKQLFEDLMPWTSSQLNKFQESGGVRGLQDRMSQNIQRSKGETNIILNQTNNGVSTRDASYIANRTLGIMPKTIGKEN